MSEAKSPQTHTYTEWLARHDRAAVIACIALAASLALFVMWRAGDAAMMIEMMGGSIVADALLLFVMWWAMMLAMMLPSAAPAILIYGALARKNRNTGVAPVAVFASGYAAIWTGFSIAAVLLQLLLRPVVELNMTMAVTSQLVGAGLLVAAGLYQMTPLKQACLRNCQSPLMHFARRWRNGLRGSFLMGLEHGAYCLGCCWVLMALLFYGGVMDLRWILGIALYIAAEKLVPAGARLPWLAGFILLAGGAYQLYAAVS